MPGLVNDAQAAHTDALPDPEYGFVVGHQKVEFEVDFTTQTLAGRCEITIYPLSKGLRAVRIDARQCAISRDQVLVNGKVAQFDYEDPYKQVDVPEFYEDIAQYELQRHRLRVFTNTRANGALMITFPKDVRPEEVDPLSGDAITQRTIAASVPRNASVALDGVAVAVTPVLAPKTAAEQASGFKPITIVIPFISTRFRDGLHFVGLEPGDSRYPHVYTKHSIEPGTASCIFPCIDDLAMRCTWEITIKCSSTLGDAMKRRSPPKAQSHHHRTNGHIHSGFPVYEVNVAETDKLLEMAILCSGEQVDDKVDPEDTSKKVATFQCNSEVAAQQIGFAIGPFQEIDLSEYRIDVDGEKLGQGQSTAIYGYCLPGREDELRNTCLPMAQAIDYMTLSYGKFPYSECRLAFVDDQVTSVEHTASLSLCSSRLLFPQEIIDPEEDNTRKIVHAIASQWLGVSIIPENATDRWIPVAMSYFMTDSFMRDLCGKNAFLLNQKKRMDLLREQDQERPSLFALGEALHLGSFEMDFMTLKAPLVLFILNSRIAKSNGSSASGLQRVISKLIVTANTSSGGVETVVSNDSFRKICEKITKYRDTLAFWNQWIMSSGHPDFLIGTKFNKKRVVIEVTLKQTQDTNPTQRDIKKDSFLRLLKEEVNGVWAGEVQSCFSGPMTVRIHEADGTPYEHIVSLKEKLLKLEIPYATKYKRLKKGRMLKERALAAIGGTGDESERIIYALGEVLTSEEDMAEWHLTGWDLESEAAMEQEAYEWLRVDSDFEWLCSKEHTNMPPWMYVSQLTSDRDVVAQYESLAYMSTRGPSKLSSTVLVRTVIDDRYFHGIRTKAAELLRMAATEIGQCEMVGMTHLMKAYERLFCEPESKTHKPNNFSEKKNYFVEGALLRSMAQIRDKSGKCPKEARRFILEQLQLNDNTGNEYSDNYKVANLLSSLTTSLLPLNQQKKDQAINFDDEDLMEDDEPEQYLNTVLEEIDRYARADEYLHSFQNIYTVTALDCKQRLMRDGVIPVRAGEFLRYVLDGNADNIRVKAFSCLVNLGMLKNMAFFKLLLSAMSTDSSPYVRKCLVEVFAYGMAMFAFGETTLLPPPPVDEMAMDGLVIEQDASTTARKALADRTQTILGALAALKSELKDIPAVQDAIWKAVRSPVITVSEQLNLLDICSILFESKPSLVVKLKYPRQKHCSIQNLGQGKVMFTLTPSEKIRTKPRPNLRIKKILPIPVEIPPPVTLPPVQKIKFTAPSAVKPGVPKIRLHSTAPSLLPKVEPSSQAAPLPTPKPRLPLPSAPIHVPKAKPTIPVASLTATKVKSNPPAVSEPAPKTTSLPPIAAPPQPKVKVETDMESSGTINVERKERPKCLVKLKYNRLKPDSQPDLGSAIRSMGPPQKLSAAHGTVKTTTKGKMAMDKASSSDGKSKNKRSLDKMDATEGRPKKLVKLAYSTQSSSKIKEILRKSPKPMMKGQSAQRSSMITSAKMSSQKASPNHASPSAQKLSSSQKSSKSSSGLSPAPRPIPSPAGTPLLSGSINQAVSSPKHSTSLPSAPTGRKPLPSGAARKPLPDSAPSVSSPLQATQVGTAPKFKIKLKNRPSVTPTPGPQMRE